MIRAIIYVGIWIGVGYELESVGADPIWHQLAGAIIAYLDIAERYFSKESARIEREAAEQ